MTTHTKMPTKALSMGAAALVLGSTFATGGAIAASPDSTFGFVQSAHAAEVLPTSAFTVTSVPDPLNQALTKVTVAFDFTGQTVNEGDFFTINLDLGNAPAYSDVNTYNGQQVINGGTLFENTTAHSANATWAGNHYTDLFAGKNIAVDLTSRNLTPGRVPATITDAQGNVMFNLVMEGNTTAKYVATSYASSRANLTGSLTYLVDNHLVSAQYNATTLIDGTLKVNENTLTFTDGTKAGDYVTADSPGSEYADVFDTKVPASVYINGDLKNTFNGNLRVGFAMRKEVRNTSSSPAARYFQDAMDSLNGYVSLYTVHATPETVGKRIQSVFTQSDATSPLADFTCDAASLQALTYAAYPHTESNGGPVLMNATEIAAAYPGGLVGTVNGSYDPWQVQVESCTSEEIVISWVPISAGDTLAFADKNIKVKYAAEVGSQQLTNGFMRLTSSNQWPDGTAVAPYSATRTNEIGQTHGYTIGSPSGNTQSYASWSGTASFSDAFPVATPDTSTTTANTPVSSKLITNDEFPESSYGSTTITGQPSNGTVTVAADGTATYTPNPGFVGTDVVTYKNVSAAGVESNETTWTIEVVAPAAPNAQPDTVNVGYQGSGSVSLTNNDTANGNGNRVKPETAVFTDGTKEQAVDGIKVSINNDGSFNVDASGSTHSGTYELEYNVYDIYGTPAKAKVTVNVGEPTIGISVKALIDGQDANDKDNPVILTPGDYTVTYQITNPNKYPLDASQLKLTNGGQQVTIPEGTVIEPGQTAEVTGTVTLEKQGAVDVDAQATGTYSYTHNGEAKTITANADDPAHIKALVKAIDIEDDTNVIIAKDGATVGGNLFENDTPDADYPFLDETFEWIVPEGVEHTLSEDGNTVELPNAIVEYLGNGDYKVTYKDGVTDFKIPDLGYNISDALGDITDPATLSVKYAMVDLEVFVQDENGQWRDADDETNPVVFSDEGRKNFKFTIVNNGEVELDENLVKQLLDDTFEDVALDGTIVPGGNVEFTKAMNLTKGFYSFSFGTSNNTGAEDTDDVNLEVEKKEEPQQVPPTIIVNVPPTVVNTPVDIKITNNNGNNITIKNEGGSGNDTVTERVVGSPATPTKVKVNTGNDGDLAMVAGSGLAALFGAWVVAGRKRAGRMFRKDS